MIMQFSKFFLLCIVLCFLQHCSAQDGKDVSDTVLFLNTHKIQISSISEEEYKKAAQTEPLKIVTTSIKKSKGEIVLSLANNKKVILKDSLAGSDNSEQVTYNFIGHFKEVGLYVINVQYYETEEYLLISDKTGVITKVWGEPKLSPDKKHIACASNAIGYDIMPNGIQIWLVQKDTLKLDWESKQEQWGPMDIIWVTENKFYFTKHIPNFISYTQKEERRYAEISFK